MSLLPNFIPLAIGAALMYMLDIYIDVGTVLVFSVCFGIAIDDTIHFLVDYNRQKVELGPEKAIEHTLLHTGNTLILTTLTLIFGFGVFMLGDFIPNINFGLLCMTVLTIALVVDLFFLPALLKIVDRKKS